MLDEHTQFDLNMKPTVVDQCVYYLFRSGERIGINASYVDHLNRVGNDKSKSIMNNALDRFEPDQILRLISHVCCNQHKR